MASSGTQGAPFGTPLPKLTCRRGPTGRPEWGTPNETLSTVQSTIRPFSQRDPPTVSQVLGPDCWPDVVKRAFVLRRRDSGEGGGPQAMHRDTRWLVHHRPSRSTDRGDARRSPGADRSGGRAGGLREPVGTTSPGWGHRRN